MHRDPLITAGTGAWVRDDAGNWYVLSMLLAAYERGELAPGSAAERCAKWHRAALSQPCEPQVLMA